MMVPGTGLPGGCRVALLLAILAGTQAAAQPSPSPAPATDGEAPLLTVEVRYLTNRRRDLRGVAADAYSGERGVPEYGRCRAEFEPIKALDQLASRLPFYLPSERREVVAAVPEAAPVFWARLGETLDDDPAARPVVVFVHGYSNGFTRNCRMTAELQRSLGERATVLMFSWPSNGRPTDYVSDQADLEWSVPLLAELLRRLGERFGSARVQLVAHSLGSRGSLLALQRLGADGVSLPVVDQLVLLAPDYDAQTFVELLPRLRPLAGSITLYASDNDTPLRVSEELNGYPRLGQAGEHLTVAEGMETIDVTSAGLYQALGHEYYYYHPSVAADLVAHIASGAAAAQRSGLQLRRRGSGRYWELLPPQPVAETP